ncbi:fungal-specific transcription factor domain-containing protein [Fennellomyces sp. T-0311]|nr:fungal-specific transcription factor domain-containing protein [Fennellomyces sp. T-0311]
MEKLLTSLTNSSIKELERNDFQFDENRRKKGKARAANVDDQDESSTTSPDDNDDDEYDDDDVSIGSNMSNPNVSLEERLSNLDIKDYDAITYTGRSASMELLNTEMFRFKPFVAWPGRSDVALQLTAQNELMVVRSIDGPATRLDIGLSMRSGGADVTATMNKDDAVDVTPPSNEEQEQMLTFFFEHLHPFMPIINKTRFLSAEQPPTVLVQAMLALTFRFVSQHNDQPKAAEYASMYFAKVMKRLRDPVRSRLCHVQAAVLMTLYLDMDDGDDSMQWYMLGTAIRMAQDLGLHRSCSHWKILPQAEIETRHRLFYACYILDRWLSARAGKPLTILDRDFDTPMPSNNEYQAFAVMIKLSEILGRVLKALYAPKAKHANANAGLDDPTVIDAFDRRLKSCKAALELELPPVQKMYLDIFYHTVLLLLHRPFVTQQLSHQICTHAASTISELVRQLRQRPKNEQYFTLCMPTCFVYALFQSTLIHLTNAVRNPSSLDMFQQSVALMQQYNHLAVVRRALEIVELFRTMHAPAVDAAAAAAVAAARVAAIHAMPFPPTMMLSDIYSVSQPPTPLVGGSTGAAPLYDWSPLLPHHHHHHHHHQPPSQQQQPQQPQPQQPTPQQPQSQAPAHSADMATVFPTFQEELISNNLTLTASPTPMHATLPTTTAAPSSQPYHANSTSSTSSSSTSSFISTPHPMAAILPPANLHWTDWDVYLDDRSCQPQPSSSRHHHSASFPQTSFPHHPHPPP